MMKSFSGLDIFVLLSSFDRCGPKRVTITLDIRENYPIISRTGHTKSGPGLDATSDGAIHEERK